MRLDAYLVGRRFPLIASPQTRPWMDNTPERYAYRCLPLLIANQNGWLICSPEDVAVYWHGGDTMQDVEVQCEGNVAVSHFGSAIVTFRIPYLFRTEPGYNLWAHGPPNYAKPGLYPLEGIVETDWAVATFTFNWQITQAGRPLVWEKDEPICMITPIKRGEVEQFEPVVKNIDDDPELAEQYRAWEQSRSGFLVEQKGGGDVPPWQRDYFRGSSPGGWKAPPGEHQTRLKIQAPRWSEGTSRSGL